MPATLTLCPTPIGNLNDVSERQLAALRGADVIASEDTRTTRRLLDRLGIVVHDAQMRFQSYHDHNEQEATEVLLRALCDGQNVVLVSDAGTPTIADPGYRLVRACREQQIPVVGLPGPVAAMVALSISGLPTDAFAFRGFLPAKSAARQDRLRALHKRVATQIFYVAPHRLVAVLEDMAEVWGPERLVFLGRELTKLHEEHFFGPIAEVLSPLAERDKVRGECVLVVEGNRAPIAMAEDDDVERWIDVLLDAEIPTPIIKRAVAEISGQDKKQIFQRIAEQKKRRR